MIPSASNRSRSEGMDKTRLDGQVAIVTGGGGGSDAASHSRWPKRGRAS